MSYHLLKNRAISFPPKPHTPLHAYRFANWAIQELLGSDSHTNIGNKTLALDQKHIVNVFMKEQKKKKMKRNNLPQNWACYYLIFNSICQMESWRDDM